MSGEVVESRGKIISEFEASLVYRASSSIARATEKNLVSKNQSNNNKKYFQKKQSLEGQKLEEAANWPES